MSGAGSSTRWWLGACGAAALLLCLSVALLLRGGRSQPARGGAPAALPCSVPASLPLRGLPGEDHAPVRVGAEPGVRLRVDGQPAGDALTLAPGEHRVRVEAEDEAATDAPLEWRLRFDAYTPALLHAQRLPGAGLTLVALGAVCTSCPAPLRPESLAPEGPRQDAAPLLAEAARAMRTGDWPRAAAALRGVRGEARRRAPYLRLAAGVYAASVQPAAARRALEAVPAREAGALPRLLAALDALGPAEARRRSEVTLARWNRLTERYGALVQRFEPQVPAQVAGAGKRLEGLSSAFEAAARARDDEAMEAALAAAEAALGTLVAQVRGARPTDCRFQADVVATLRDEGS